MNEGKTWQELYESITPLPKPLKEYKGSQRLMLKLTDEDKEKIKKITKEWKKRNPEKVKNYRKKYYEKHKERIKKIQKKWLKKNYEKVNKYYRDYYKKMKEAKL